MTNKQAYWINLAKNNPDEFKRRRRMAYWKHLQQNNPEEYRAKRRAAYAAKHANDPMTEHRRACIEAQHKRMEKPLADRKAEIMAAKAEKAAKKDMQEDGYLQTEEKSERKRETVIKFIECWAHIRKGFRLSSLMIPDPDKAYYLSLIHISEPTRP